MTAADKFALALSVLLLIILYAFFWAGIGPANQLTVAAGGEAQTFSLRRDQRIAVSGLRGKTIIEVERGRARFVASPCSGKVCIHMGWLDQAGETAACVPNGVIVSLAGHDNHYDSINF